MYFNEERSGIVGFRAEGLGSTNSGFYVRVHLMLDWACIARNTINKPSL